MKATGVVRRIDDLGRIVIPKEIRKTLRIKEGTPLEIFTEKEGDIILKKYSPIGELQNFSTEYVECLSKVTNYISIVTDKDSVIAISGAPKKDYLEQSISEDLEKIIDKRDFFVADYSKAIYITAKGEKEKSTREKVPQVIVPIISESEVIGSVIILSKDVAKEMTTTEIEVAKVAASFLGTQMEI